MKFELGAELTGIIKESLDELGLPDTIENRRSLVEFCLSTGISFLFLTSGAAIKFKERFNQSLDRIYADDELEEEVKPKHAPDPCPKCGITPRYNGRVWACNCQTFEVGPKPESTCPHCKKIVRPEHYYWVCDCNRYDESPDAPISLHSGNKFPDTPPGLSNSFPGS